MIRHMADEFRIRRSFSIVGAIAEYRPLLPVSPLSHEVRIACLIACSTLSADVPYLLAIDG